jgi:hypothetical protein
MASCGSVMTEPITFRALDRVIPVTRGICAMPDCGVVMIVVTFGALVVWMALDVRGFRLVLPCHWHCAQ